MKFKAGCFPNGEIVHYKPFKKAVSITEPAQINLSGISIEVRAVEDPYIVFAMVNKQDKAD